MGITKYGRGRILSAERDPVEVKPKDDDADAETDGDDSVGEDTDA